MGEAEQFSTGYKRFLDNGKTERECVREAAAMLEMQGYVPFDRTKSYIAGDKVYQINRGKAIIATTFGREGLEKGLRMNGAHIDSPRLDLKPNPLYEKKRYGLFLRPIITAESVSTSGLRSRWPCMA